MPISTDIQNKVLKIAANKAINNKGKLAVRKGFYELQIEQITLEEAQEEFNRKAAQFDAELNAILEQLNNLPTEKEPEVVVQPKVVAAPTKEYGDEDEQIMVPAKPVQKVAGIQVRMQEELETNSNEDTDVEVPFEADDQQ